MPISPYGIGQLKMDYPDFQRHIHRLKEKDNLVMTKRVNGQTLASIATILQVTPERVRQIEARACRRLMWYCQHMKVK